MREHSDVGTLVLPLTSFAFTLVTRLTGLTLLDNSNNNNFSAGRLIE